MITLERDFKIDLLEEGILYIDPTRHFTRQATYFFISPYLIYMLIKYSDNDLCLYKDNFPTTGHWISIKEEFVERIVKTYFAEVLMEEAL